MLPVWLLPQRLKNWEIRERKKARDYSKETERDEVRFKSFCLEHSASSSATPPTTPLAAAHANGSQQHHTATAPAANGAHTPTTPDRFRPETAHHPGAGHGGGGGVANGRHGDPELRPGLSASERAEREQLEREKVSQRKQKLQELEDEFYRLVDPREVAQRLDLPHSQVGPLLNILCIT